VKDGGTWKGRKQTQCFGKSVKTVRGRRLLSVLTDCKGEKNREGGLRGRKAHIEGSVFRKKTKNGTPRSKIIKRKLRTWVRQEKRGDLRFMPFGYFSRNSTKLHGGEERPKKIIGGEEIMGKESQRKRAQLVKCPTSERCPAKLQARSAEIQKSKSSRKKKKNIFWATSRSWLV